MSLVSHEVGVVRGGRGGNSHHGDGGDKRVTRLWGWETWVGLRGCNEF